MKEFWENIVGFQGYQVSNLGEVRALHKVVTYSDGRVFSYPERKLKQWPDKNGYLLTGITVKNKTNTLKVHRLVAEHFLSPLGCRDHVNHKDGDKSNNSVENLEYVNAAENNLHAQEEGLNGRNKDTGKFESPKKYVVTEIFNSIQGEGSHSGRNAIFLRLSGCNKWSNKEEDRAKSVCHFCDTFFSGKDRYSVNDILGEISKIAGKCKLVVITGGEPLLQLDNNLLFALKKDGYEIHLETNGSIDLGTRGRYIDHISMSPKQSPSKTKLTYCDDLKLLFPSISEETAISHWKNFKCEHRFLQPVDGPNLEFNTFQVVEAVREHPEYRASIQLHKILGEQ